MSRIPVRLCPSQKPSMLICYDTLERMRPSLRKHLASTQVESNRAPTKQRYSPPQSFSHRNQIVLESLFRTTYRRWYFSLRKLFYFENIVNKGFDGDPATWTTGAPCRPSRSRIAWARQGNPCTAPCCTLHRPAPTSADYSPAPFPRNASFAESPSTSPNPSLKLEGTTTVPPVSRTLS